MKNIIFLVVIAFMISCKNENSNEGIPYVPVTISINLLDPNFQELKVNGGYVYVTGGVKGILVYRESSGSYLAFERSCTYLPNSDCARISMDSSQLFLVDTCCSSQFTLEGNVLTGVAPYALKQYTTNLDGTILYINN